MILVCGEALVDLFVEAPRAGGPAALAARAVAAGSPFNVAVGLARLGTPTGYLGGIGSDVFGDLLASRLRAEGVDASLARRSPRPTPIAVVAAGPDGQPAYTFHAEGCADRDLSPADLPVALPPGVSALAFGSYALAVEPVGSALLALAEREAGRLAICLDPNLRPALVGGLPAWRERIARFARVATVIKLSAEDFAAGWEGASLERQVSDWLAAGTELVVATDGAAGAAGYTAGLAVRAPGRPVVVADTVGAGDSFHAALLSGLAATGRLRPGGPAGLDEAELGALLARAVLASSLTCARPGADPPTAAELRAAEQAMG